MRTFIRPSIIRSAIIAAGIIAAIWIYAQLPAYLPADPVAVAKPRIAPQPVETDGRIYRRPCPDCALKHPVGSCRTNSLAR